MDFAFTQEQEQVREVARRYLGGRYSAERVAEIADSPSGWDSDGWTPVVAMGWLDPELGMVELALLAEEAGYALHPVPWWSTVRLGDLRSHPHARATLALPGQLVPDLTAATEIVVSSDAGLLRIDAKDVTGSEQPSIDGLRRMSELDWVDAPAKLLVPSDAAHEALQRIRWRSLALLACEAVGVTRRAIDLAVDYAKIREQFDRPIGSYQGVAFRVADSYVSLELARSLAYRAAWLVGQDNGPSIADEAVACAVVTSRRAALGACEAAIQIFGGIAMTWEHPIHRWYRRALWWQAFGTSSQQHRADLASALLGPL